MDVQKYIVGKLNGYGDFDLYLKKSGVYHNWVTGAGSASQMTYKQAVKEAARLNRESTHSAYAIRKI